MPWSKPARWSSTTRPRRRSCWPGSIRVSTSSTNGSNTFSRHRSLSGSTPHMRLPNDDRTVRCRHRSTRKGVSHNFSGCTSLDTGICSVTDRTRHENGMGATAASDLAPLLSVLMRTQHRRPATLEEALLSLAAQSCDDFELLLLAHDVSE